MLDLAPGGVAYRLAPAGVAGARPLPGQLLEPAFLRVAWWGGKVGQVRGDEVEPKGALRRQVGGRCDKLRVPRHHAGDLRSAAQPGRAHGVQLWFRVGHRLAPGQRPLGRRQSGFVPSGRGRTGTDNGAHGRLRRGSVRVSGSCRQGAVEGRVVVGVLGGERHGVLGYDVGRSERRHQIA